MDLAELECHHLSQVDHLALLVEWTVGGGHDKGGPGPFLRTLGEALPWIWWTGGGRTLMTEPGTAGPGHCRNYLEGELSQHHGKPTVSSRTEPGACILALCHRTHRSPCPSCTPRELGRPPPHSAASAGATPEQCSRERSLQAVKCSQHTLRPGILVPALLLVYLVLEPAV